MKGQYNFEQTSSLTSSWRFLRSNTLDKLGFKFEKNNNWGLETYRKGYKKIFIYQKNSGGENREAHILFVSGLLTNNYLNKSLRLSSSCHLKKERN